MKTLIFIMFLFGQILTAQTKDVNEETKKGVVETLTNICNSGSNKNLSATVSSIDPKLTPKCADQQKKEKAEENAKKEKEDKKRSILEFGFPNFKLDYYETSSKPQKKYAVTFVSAINESDFKYISNNNGITKVNQKDIKFTDGTTDFATFNIKDVDGYDTNFVLVKVIFSKPIDIKIICSKKCECNSTEIAPIIFSSTEMYYIIPASDFDEFKNNLDFLKTYYSKKQAQSPQWVDPKQG